MQSIFTYDPDPPRVSSPWRVANGEEVKQQPHLNTEASYRLENLTEYLEDVHLDTPENLQIDRLEAEPQVGPTEYKVHLLLRPRQTHVIANHAKFIGGSQHSRDVSTLREDGTDYVFANTSLLSPSSSTKQHRLEQLTTQLLWRLQQSSPFHTASSSNLILPSLPEGNGDLLEPQKPVKLLPGLEESNGALYEIGVSDDGSFVGLTKKEMQESLNNLQAMAACLGCAVEILRMVCIGRAECVDEHFEENGEKRIYRRLESLYVAEAYVKPVLEKIEKARHEETRVANDASGTAHSSNISGNILRSDRSLPREQLRITLTGATTSGKSSLLGTLSMSTLDNGHGKSRLSLLKHRHELASGMTSSVAQELIGYRGSEDISDSMQKLEVVNYASNNISSWNDIHAASDTGRLAFISDSAGHPRYRRTTVRGLLSWTPHWTMLCVPASDNIDLSVPNPHPLNSAENGSPSFTGASAHLSMAQLDLCLKLDLPLLIIITKLDTASKQTFRQILSTLLSALKVANRRPALLPNDTEPVQESDLQNIPEQDTLEVNKVIDLIKDHGKTVVPIVFTSAVSGVGIGKMHALLRQLPVRPADARADNSSPRDSTEDAIFHVDEIYKLEHGKARLGAEASDSLQPGSVVSGHLVSGEVTVGQEMFLGPFSTSIERSQNEKELAPLSNPEDPFLTPRSFSDALAQVTAPPLSPRAAEHEWRRVKVISARNLRLPVQTLLSDRVGTLGIVLIDNPLRETSFAIRRGMILTDSPLEAAHTITAQFDIHDASSLVVGNRVVLYSASVRSSAKVVAVALRNQDEVSEFDIQSQEGSFEDDLAFAMDDEGSVSTASTSRGSETILVTLQLDTYRVWIAVGAKLLVMPGGGPGLHAGDRGVKGLAGLEGFVGCVIEAFG